MADITLDGFAEFEQALGKAGDLFVPLATFAMTESLAAVQEAIEPYPPQPDRMRSGEFNGYVRGRGVYPKSAFKADEKAEGGFAFKARKGAALRKAGKVRFTSEQMDKKFRITVTASTGYIAGNLHNDASYSGWVLGPADAAADPHQVSFHKETGWVDTDEAIEQATPTIEKSLDDAVDQFLAILGG